MAHQRRIHDLAKGLRVLTSGEGLGEDFQCFEIILGAPWVKRGCISGSIDHGRGA